MKKQKCATIVAPKPLPTQSPSVEWDKCIICQKIGDLRDLNCSASNPVESSRTKGYESISCAFERLRVFDRFVLPSCLSISQLDEGEGIFKSLENHKAVWHRNCARPYQRDRLDKLVAKLSKERSEQLKNVAEDEKEPAQEDSGRRSTRSASVAIDLKESLCFLCNEPASSSLPLRQCETKEIFDHIKASAEAAGAWRILGLLSEGDLIAQEAKYHPRCLVSLYNSARRARCKQEKDQGPMACESIAFADLVMFIHSKLKENENFVFKLSDLRHQYFQRLCQLLGPNVDTHPDVSMPQSTRLRFKILAAFPNLKAEKHGREYLLMKHNANLIPYLPHEDEDQESDALGFFRFLKTVRKIIETHPSWSFPGSFDDNCQSQAVPPVLLAVMNALLYGSPVGADSKASTPATNLAQLVISNYKKRVPQGNIVRMDSHRETPLTLYMGLSFYHGGRNKHRIEENHQSGLSVSATRIMEVTSQLCHLTVHRAKEEGVLLPSNLKKGLFTLSHMDNIDFKCRSTSGNKEFHGTGISFMQAPLQTETGTSRVFVTNFQDVAKKGCYSVPELPEFYSYVPEAALATTKPENTKCSMEMAEKMLDAGEFSMTWQKEKWFDMTGEVLREDVPLVEDFSWSAFHASQSKVTLGPAILSGLLPLFEEKSESIPMVKHTFDIVMKSTQYLNEGQVPVLCMDAKIYAVAKTLQYNRLPEYGEDKLVLMLGPLHTEQAFLRTIGQFMEGSGWTDIIAGSGLRSGSAAEAVLKVTHITRARMLHQQTAAVLHSLMMDAYRDYKDDCDEEGVLALPLESWVQESYERPLFRFWLTVLNLEVILLAFVRSVRNADFILHKESIKLMIPWFFILDHQTYARWLAVHLKDLEELSSTAPSVFSAFMEGKFVVNKSGKPMSCIGIDQAHEQSIDFTKNSQKVIGLSNDPSALRRVMTCGPQVSALVKQFTGEDLSELSSLGLHHEQQPRFQQQFLEGTQALKQAFLEFDNPFSFKGNDLICLSSRAALSDDFVKTFQAASSRAQAMFREFVLQRLLVGSVETVYSVLKKAKLSIFSNLKAHKKKAKSDTLKDENEMYYRLFAASISRDLDLDSFFEYENHTRGPPCLSQDGKIRQGQGKCELAKLIEKDLPPFNNPSHCDGLVIDAPALVRNYPPRAGRSFQDYAKYLLTIIGKLAVAHGCSQVAICFDLYFELSIKAAVRESRGTGIRMPDLPGKGTVPKDWESYIQNNQNKSELFTYLARAMLSAPTELQIVVNVGDTVKASPDARTSLDGKSCGMAEEADGRMLAHVRDMVQHGARIVLLRSSDTDVEILAVSHYWTLHREGLQELWLLSGVPAKARYVPLHLIAQMKGERFSVALRGFHSYSGDDACSHLASKGKKTCYETWLKFPEVTDAFIMVATPQPNFPEAALPLLERFMVLLYDPKSDHHSVNKARKDLFLSGNKPLTRMPATSDCHTLHCHRVFYDAGIIGGNCLSLDAYIPPPTKFGWKIENGLVPLWTTKPTIWAACRELDRCGCKTGCSTQRCCCRRAELLCTPACKVCKGEKCENSPAQDNAEV